MARSAPRKPAASDAVKPALQKRSQEKRDLLIKAGIRAFARDGYDGAKIVDIAKDAGISVGVFYQRFKDKRGFFNALEARFVERGKENWDRFCNESDPEWSARDLLTQMVRNLGNVIGHNEGFFRALVTLGHQDKSVFPPGVAMDRHGADRVADVLLARGFIDPRDMDREQVYFAVASVSKVLVLMTLIDTNAHRATDEFTVEQLTIMLARYLQIEI